MCGWSEAQLTRARGDVDDTENSSKGRKEKKHKQKALSSRFNDVGDQHFNYFPFCPLSPDDNDEILKARLTLSSSLIPRHSKRTSKPPETSQGSQRKEKNRDGKLWSCNFFFFIVTFQDSSWACLLRLCRYCSSNLSLAAAVENETDEK